MSYYAELMADARTTDDDHYDRIDGIDTRPAAYRAPVQVAYYYDLSQDHALSSDPEGNLVALCRGCAATHRADVRWAGSCDYDDARCELCDA